MDILSQPLVPEPARRYWALGDAQVAFDSIIKDARAGRLTSKDANNIAFQFPFLALEDAARRTGFARLQEATQDDQFIKTVLLVIGDDVGMLSLLQRRAAQYWMRLVYDATGQTSHTVSPTLAASLRGTELHGYTCEDVRLPVRALHIGVPPDVVGLELPDSDGAKWTATDLLIVEESGPRLWRLCLEALTGEGRSAHVVTMHLPPGMPLEKAVAQHEAKAAPGLDWRPLWTWAIGAVLSLTPPASRA
ncbi:hypothetical protein [Myxococcus sp. AB056]|uniref:hypothetical protein n=1 Tax=Myxococcaceae TaxID=31 RepID=UPI00114621F0|nr:hypothetical protein [Myxococcus sp. AB056]